LKAAKETLEVNPKEPEALLVREREALVEEIVRSSNGAVPLESKIRQNSAWSIKSPG
jgi:hypothetical protein